MTGSALFAFPVGVMSGIYMNEYAPKGWIVRFIRMMTNNLSGIPSIVFGLFGMALFVNYMDFGDSILAGSLTLGLLSLPLVIRTTEEALKAIPDNLREGSRALGATKLQTIWHVILPMGMPNIITGLILALGRVSGVFVANSRVWESLDENTRQLLQACATESCEWGRDHLEAEEDQLIQGFMDSGMQVDILTEDQLQAFKDAVAGVTADLKAEYGEDACAAFGIN